MRRSAGALVVVLVGMAVASCGAIYGADEEPAKTPEVDCGAACSSADAASDATTEASSDAAVSDGAGSDAPGSAFVTLATGVDEPSNTSLDSNYVYYTNGRSGEVRRCSINGCAQPELVASGQSVPGGLTVAGGTIYWSADFRYLRTCSAASVAPGTPCQPALFRDVGATTYPGALTSRGTRLYWAILNGATKSILTCPLSGCTAGYPKVVYASAAGQPLHDQSIAGIALDSSYLYVSRFLGGIVRLTMTTPETANSTSGVVITSTPYTTDSLELDGTTLRWSSSDDGTIRSCTASNCDATKTTFRFGRQHPEATVSNATYVFGADHGPDADGGGVVPNSGVLWRLSK
jgi:hypothetical protein